MKIRMGFVTNSSSTSFCIVGKYFELDDLRTWFTNHAKTIVAIYEKRTGKELDITGLEEEFPFNLGDLVDLNVYSDGEYACYIGLDVTRMKDSDTLGGFKKEIQDIMKTLGLLKSKEKVEIIMDTIEG